MTLLYSDPLFLEHDTGRHPERADRLRAITRQLERSGLDKKCKTVTWEAASPMTLALVHDPAYIDRVRALAEHGGGPIEADTMMSRRSYEVACYAAGAVCDAVRRVVDGQDKRALCLVRPPGHHALRDDAMGFCLFGNVAICARLATRMLKLRRVLIVDWDVHHGNGTQNAFWTDGQVGFLSIHRWPFYPGTGDKDETGSGAGLGMIRNLPVEFGTERSEYLKRLRNALDDFATKVKPELVILSAGFDAHREDPVGSLELETEDFAPLTDMVLDIADDTAGGKVVSVLEGGYNTSILAGCVELHLERLLARESPDSTKPG